MRFISICLGRPILSREELCMPVVNLLSFVRDGINSKEECELWQS